MYNARRSWFSPVIRVRGHLVAPTAHQTIRNANQRRLGLHKNLALNEVFMVGEVGLEPTILAEHDFESCAYTNSATRPEE